MLRTFSAIVGDKAAPQVQAPPGWEKDLPQWASFRIEVGEIAWSTNFAGCIPGNEAATILLTDTSFNAQWIERHYATRLRRHFGCDIETIYVPAGRVSVA